MATGVTFLAIRAGFKKFWVWCKKYWQIFLGLAIPIILMLVFRKKGDLSAVVDRVHEDYQKEIDIINRAHDQEIAAREEALRRYHDRLSEIEKKYAESNEAFTSKRRKEVERLLKNSESDADEITKRLAEITGFTLEV